MNVAIEGNVRYVCTSCKETYNLDGKSLTFHEDASPKPDDDAIIRYVSPLSGACTSCGQEVRITLEVWEHPKSVINYSYYSTQGVSAVACEFTIEHYFDDEVAMKENGQYESDFNGVIEDEGGEKIFNETSTVQGYTDQYDQEE